MLRDSKSYEVQIIDAVRSVNKALGGTYGTSSAIYKNEFNQYEVQLIDAIKGIGKTLSGHGLSLVGGGVGEVTAEQFQALSQRVTKLEKESFFRLVDGNVTLKPEYQNLWVPGWLAAGGIGNGSGGGGTVEHLYDIGDVTIDQATLADGQGIVWDATEGVWKNASIGSTYTLPTASTSVLGGVKIDGTTITINNNGVISAVGGGGSFNGGEITNDLWLHTGGDDYGSTLFFGDKNGNTGYAYIKEDSDDHLTIYGRLGVTITTGDLGSVVIEGLSVALGELSDVSLSNLSDGQGIVWDAANQVWKNATIGGGGGGGGSYYAGTGISIDSNNYISIKTASTSQLGGVKVDGTTITISNGVISASGGGGGGGTVTSVAMTVPTGLSVSGTPITSSGTLAVSLASGYVIPQQATLDNFVTLNTTQEISGAKTFKDNDVTFTASSGLSLHQSSHIDIGPLRIEYDANSHALHITKVSSSDNNTYGIYADGFVAAGGIQ